jgi:nicotinamidase-related amidase
LEVLAMATVREGNIGVLLVVDVQVGVLREAWEAPRVIANVARTVERARAQGVPVLWVQHADNGLTRGSADWQWVPELVPAPGEPLFHKQFNSSFEQTTLEEELASLGATHIVLAGAASNWCIRATAYGALERGYDLTLVEDAHTTGTLALDDGTSVQADSVIRELNIAMAWLSYPGRKNGTATAEAVDFARPGGVDPPAG